MKKSLIVTLALVFVLGIAGTAFAANPFVDVPAKHWSYDAVAKLAQAGIVDGYGDGTFKGDKTMTRYEMATVVAKAMAKSDKADAEQKAAIDKLAAEFSAELANLGVKVAALEKKAAADTVNVTGYARVRYEHTKNDATPNAAASVSNTLRARLFFNGQINDAWTWGGRLQVDHNMMGNDAIANTLNWNNHAEINNAYVSGPIGGSVATFGRFDFLPNYGLMLDSTINGAKFSFGNVVKADVYAGKFQRDSVNRANGQITGDDNFYGAAFKYAVASNTNITAGYYNAKNSGRVFNKNTSDSLTAYELGFDTKFNEDWAFQAGYGKTNVDDKNKAYFAQVNYKGADKAKVGSWGAYLNYRKLDQFGTMKTTFDNAFATNGGGQGYEVGFNYAPMANTVWTTKYSEVKSTTNDTGKSKYFSTYVEFWF